MKINNRDFNLVNKNIQGLELFKKKQNHRNQKLGNEQEILLDISEQGRKASKKIENLIEKTEDKKALIEMLEDNRKSQDEESGFEIKIKCLKIYLRIVRGDIVPIKDKRYLMKHEPELYKTAILMRKQKEKPKKHKSLVKNDNKNNDTVQKEENIAEQKDPQLKVENDEPPEA